MTSLARANTLAALARQQGWTVRTSENDTATAYNGIDAVGSVNVRGVRGGQRFTVLWEKYHPKHGPAVRDVDLRGTYKLDADGQRVTDWTEVFVYLWTTEHTATVRGVRLERTWTKGKYAGQHVMTTKPVKDSSLDEVVTFRTERPMPRRVSITELKTAITSGVDMVIDRA